MAKRFGTIFLTSIINIIILIHVVIPHHHHGDVPCFKQDIEQSCCSHDHNDSDHHNCTSHQHSDKDGSCCMFEKVLLLNGQNEKNEHQCDVCMHNHNNQLIQAVLLVFKYEFYIPEGDWTENPPYLITYHSIDASRISGLRAPPIA